MRSKKRVTPAPNWSVLLCLKTTAISVGAECESTEMSRADRVSGETACTEEHVNSPARIKPKNARQKAAQSMVLSNEGGDCDHKLWIASSSEGVIGRRWCGRRGACRRRDPCMT